MPLWIGVDLAVPTTLEKRCMERRRKRKGKRKRKRERKGGGMHGTGNGYTCARMTRVGMVMMNCGYDMVMGV